VGLSLGVIAEGNPVWRDLMSENPVATAAAAVALTAALLAVVYRFRRRCAYVVPLLTGLWAIRIAVIGLHLFWLLALVTA
jgi:hypothetical protein